MKFNRIVPVMLIGKSERIKNKAFLKINGRELFLYGYKTLTKIFKDIIIVCNKDIEKNLREYNLTIISENLNLGPVGAIKVAAENIHKKYIFVVACDMPFLNRSVIEFMCQMVRNDGLVPLHNNGRVEPLHSIYKREGILEIKSLPMKSVVDMIKLMNIIYLPVNEIKKIDHNLLTFKNINTYEDIEWMKKQLGIWE